MPKCLSDFVSPEAVVRVLNPGAFGRRLPGIAFRSREFLELEYARWLNRTWLFVGRAADLPRVGDACPGCRTSWCGASRSAFAPFTMPAGTAAIAWSRRPAKPCCTSCVPITSGHTGSTVVFCA